MELLGTLLGAKREYHRFECGFGIETSRKLFHTHFTIAYTFVDVIQNLVILTILRKIADSIPSRGSITRSGASFFTRSYNNRIVKRGKKEHAPRFVRRQCV